jgi:hypothetical protein
MPAIYLDPPLSGEQRRHRLYGGGLMTFSRRATVRRSCRARA